LAVNVLNNTQKAEARDLTTTQRIKAPRESKYSKRLPEEDGK
jgi:hypothetical protein